MPSPAPAKRTQAKRPAKKAAARPTSAAKGKASAKKTPTIPGPIELLVRAVELFFSVLWLGASRGIGALVRTGRRRQGTGPQTGMASDVPGARTDSDAPSGSTEPRGLHPDHRRDGWGLLLLALGLIIAAAVFHKMPGWLGNGIYTVVVGAVGCLAWAVPLMLVGLAIRVMRHPKDSAEDFGRVTIGLICLNLGVLGIAHSG